MSVRDSVVHVGVRVVIGSDGIRSTRGVMKGGQCPKCGSVDLTESRKARYSGPEGLQMISFNACRFVELYAPDESEQSQMHRQFVLALLIAIAFPLLIILIAVAFSGRGG